MIETLNTMGRGTEPQRERARRRGGWLAALCLVLACAAPQEPVGPPPAVALRILGEPHRNLTVGVGIELSAVAVDAHGGEVLVPGTWRSSDPGVARVESPGVVRAVAFGTATITVTHAGRSATLLVSTHPHALRVRLLPTGAVVEEGEEYDVVAEFLDANAVVIAVPWDVTWDVKGGAALVPGGAQQAQRLRAGVAGALDVIATAGGFRAPLRLNVLPRNALRLTVSHFTLWADVLPDGRMAFYPDIVVEAPFEATVTRLDFDRPSMAVCATAAILPRVTTPLFDFIPYDFSWKGVAIAPGSTVELVITTRRPDGSVQTVKAQGQITMRNFGVIDHGTGNFPWEVCR